MTTLNVLVSLVLVGTINAGETCDSSGQCLDDPDAQVAFQTRVRTLNTELSSDDTKTAETTWRCVGDANNRTCVFKNLYYARTPSGSTDFLMLVPEDKVVADLDVHRSDKYDYPWTPQTQTFKSLQAIQDHVSSKAILEQQGLSLHFNPLFHHNIGHALFDGLYPAYHSLFKFGLQDEKFQPVVGVSADCFIEGGKFGGLEKGDMVEAYLPHPHYNKSLQPSKVEILHVTDAEKTAKGEEGPRCKFEDGFDSTASEIGSLALSGEGGESGLVDACCKACEQSFGCTRAVLFGSMCYFKGTCNEPGQNCDVASEGRKLCRLPQKHSSRKVTVRLLGKGPEKKVSQETTIPESWVLGRVRRRCMSEGIYETFGKAGSMLRLFEMDRDIRSNPDVMFRFDEIVIGSGGVGNMIADSSGAIGGSGEPTKAMSNFRDRMLQSHGVLEESSKSVDLRQVNDKNKPLDVIIVANKRFDSSDMEALHKVIETVNGQGRMKVSIVDWGQIGKPETRFHDHLRRVQQADVYVSSIGTALQYVPFMRDQKVYVALGSVWQRDNQLFPTFMEQQLAGGGTPYLRTLYADPGAVLRKGQHQLIGQDGYFASVNASLLLNLLGNAESLVRKGFKTPVPVEENLSPEGQLMVELCKQDPSTCETMQSNRNGGAYECGLVLWNECVVYEVGPWRDENKCTVNRKLLRKLRRERGLFSYGAPEM